jgi:DNA-binding CsgD family transcriptional regulator
MHGSGNAELVLTRQETDVAALVAVGLTDQEIADVLDIGPGMVSDQVVAILRRLGAARRDQIAVWVKQHGL